MSGKPSSSLSSPSAGSPGLAGFIKALRGTWRGALLRFLGVFALLTLLWTAIAAAYAGLLAATVRSLIPVLEASRAADYQIEGSRIIALRSIALPKTPEVVNIRQPVWSAGGDYSIVLLAALILATPGLTRRRRLRVLGVALGFLTLTHLAALIVTIEYTRLWPQKIAEGTLLPPGYTPAKLILFDWLYAFFEFMGRGFFALLIYWGIIAASWGRPDIPVSATSIGRNDPCPCGSGRKAKRCCGA